MCGYAGRRQSREYIELAVRLGGLINTKAMEAALPESGAHASEPARMTSIQPLLGPGLKAGLAQWRGQVAPQPELSDGTRLDDSVGYRFAALMRADFRRTLPDNLLDAMNTAGIALVTDTSVALNHWLSKVEAEAVMVRPDRYILGAARNLAKFRDLVTVAGGSIARVPEDAT